MAGNKFATMLQRNTHKLTAILVYAVLEWILIIFLLLNSFFTYLISKFANYFGLKPPCPWCSRVDHVLETRNTSTSYRDLVCETHAAEISKLDYCSNHGRLAESQHMCMDCLASRPSNNEESIGVTRIAFLSWVSRDTFKDGERVLRCSCCNKSLSCDLYPPYSLLHPSWAALKYTEKGSLVIEALNDDIKGIQCKELSKINSSAYYTEERDEIEKNDGDEHHFHEGTADEHQTLSDVGSFGLKDTAEEDCSRSESNLHFDEREANEHDQKTDNPDITRQGSFGMDFYHQSQDDRMIECCYGVDDSVETIHLNLERNLSHEFDRVIPIELIDISTVANQGSPSLMEECVGKQDHQNKTFNSALEVGIQANVLQEEAVQMEQNEEKKNYAEVESIEMDSDDAEKYPNRMNEDLVDHTCNHNVDLLEAQTLSTDENNIEVAATEETDENNAVVAAMKETDDLPAPEEEIKGCTKFDDQDKTSSLKEFSLNAANEPQAQESTPISSVEDVSPANADNSDEISDVAGPQLVSSVLGANYREKTSAEDKMILGNTNKEGINHNLSIRSESNEAEEEKFPETPTSVDSHYLHKKLLLFEKRESGTEESLDGSVVSEIDAGDPVLSIEKLKTALKAERKALSALYTELEEERSASAIAANQTMAMINRLQEEKAAMQMEALQYQRMMEEQAEYDQEALQLLNELMIKREKEKQELEKELEVYRKKVLDYEAKEKVRMIRKIKDGSIKSRNSSATCSNVEDIDELSIDLNREAKDEEGSIYGIQESNNNNTPDEDINLEELALDCVKQMSVLDDSLTEFEEERLSILDQLKALEEKLITLGDKEVNEDDHSVGHSSKHSVKGFDECYEFSSPEENGVSNGLSNDRHYPEIKSMGSMAKSLLPLLDAADNEAEGVLTFEENVDAEFVDMENSLILDTKKLAIEEEVDHVYERLQALEADREFLKHCMSSIKNGDKGMDLLQEILQHLRDLRAVELRVKNMSDDPLG